MIVFPNAKINLGLHVIEKRPDGFHNIETCFYPVPWREVLEIVPAKSTVLTCTGLPVPGKSEENLCMRAYKALQRDFDLPPVHMHLHKLIPMGAGLGGGSADAAFALKLLSELFNLMLDDDLLAMYADSLGSDCSFFLFNSAAVGTQRGNALKPIDLDLTGYFLVLVYPGFEVSTRAAYSGIMPGKPGCALADLLQREKLHSWRHHLINDFESTVFPKYPELAVIKEQLYERGAFYASMSGSGSSMFALYEDEVKIEWPDHFHQWRGWL